MSLFIYFFLNLQIVARASKAASHIGRVKIKSRFHLHCALRCDASDSHMSAPKHETLLVEVSEL